MRGVEWSFLQRRFPLAQRLRGHTNRNSDGTQHTALALTLRPSCHRPSCHRRLCGRTVSLLSQSMLCQTQSTLSAGRETRLVLETVSESPRGSASHRFITSLHHISSSLRFITSLHHIASSLRFITSKSWPVQSVMCCRVVSRCSPHMHFHKHPHSPLVSASVPVHHSALISSVRINLLSPTVAASPSALSSSCNTAPARSRPLLEHQLRPFETSRAWLLEGALPSNASMPQHARAVSMLLAEETAKTVEGGVGCWHREVGTLPLYFASQASKLYTLSLKRRPITRLQHATCPVLPLPLRCDQTA